MNQIKVIPSHLAKRISELNCFNPETSEFQEEKLRKLLLENYKEISRKNNFGRGTMHKLCGLVGLEVRFEEEECESCNGTGKCYHCLGKGRHEGKNWYPYDPVQNAH